ncbi:hypothetical protein [Streptomyces sp. TS71-3]|uniref:hypothetical protein n=1 Tax=Streptomyces sp. TS71-3 TaxID=2733862 RepID=UPI001BB367D0|nr:hypothetical protein [Streptomyces sp. TS71-3]
MKLRHGITTAATAAAVLAGTALLATPASAAPAAAKATAPYNGVCGAGYDVIATTPIHNVGVTYVTWSSAADKVCAVTIRNTPGAREYMNVTLDTWPESTHPVSDPGSFTTYAGPVYNPTPGPGQCLQWSGSIDIYYDGGNGNCA